MLTRSLSKIVVRGRNFSGCNKNGFMYEKMTDLNTEYRVLKSYKHYKNVRFMERRYNMKATSQSNLFKAIKPEKGVIKAHGCKNPDECYIDEKKKIMFILEKKFQKVGGSACEKIQTPDFKLWQYSRTFPKYEVVYIYCLSDWFREHCKAELEYLLRKKIPVFWGDDVYYKKKMIDFIVDY